MPPISAADTAWLLVATALVLMMTPALGFFYGGMVRAKNALNTLMMSFSALGFVGLAWAFFGYSVAFGHASVWCGGADYFVLHGVGLEAHGTIPHVLFFAYQGTFAIITAALISGAVVERMRFGAYVAFITLWSLIVYAPIAHWVWGGGWLGKLGALDFAGGTVVHINAGIAALACALALGKRVGFNKEPMAPHNLVLTVIGASLLWVGWFGFNAGSAVAADGRAGMAMAVTQIATAAAALAWMLMEWAVKGKPSVLGIASGAVAGLVAITPASGFVMPTPAVIVGVAAGVICFFAATSLKKALGYDDSLDAFGVHCIGGIVGALLTGVFASTALDGGQAGSVVTQLKAVLATLVYGFVVSYLILKVIDMTIGLRVSEEDEREGLDVSLHGEHVE